MIAKSVSSLLLAIVTGLKPGFSGLLWMYGFSQTKFPGGVRSAIASVGQIFASSPVGWITAQLANDETRPQRKNPCASEVSYA